MYAFTRLSTKNTSLISLAFIIALSSAACSNGGGSSYCDAFCQLDKGTNINKKAWYNASAQVCAPTGGAPAAGCDFSWTGKKVSLTQDPNVNSLSEVQLIPGYNGQNDQVIIPATTTKGAVTIYNAQSGAAPVTYNGWILSFSGDYYGTDANGNRYSFGTMSLLSPDGVLYDVYGNALNFVGSEQASGSRDVLTSAAQKQAASINVLSQGLQAKYNLDSAASLNMAKMIASDIKRPAGRGYAPGELNAMSAKMYGVQIDDMKNVVKLAQAGHIIDAQAAAQNLISTAAAVNRTTPENMRHMLNDFYGDLLPAGVSQ